MPRALLAPRVDGAAPPRRPAAGRLPHADARRRPRPGRPARVPAPRRRAPHRLERHRAPAAAARARVHRRPRDVGLVPARPEPGESTSAPTAHQARSRPRLRRRAGAPAHAPRQPRRRPALRHRRRHRAPGARRPPRTCCTCCSAWRRGRPKSAAGATDLRDLLARRPAHDQAPLDACSSSPTSSASPAGRSRSASWRSATR